MAKMWAGRFQKEVDEKVNDFNSSISFDQRMTRNDIQGAWRATMLGETGIIEKQEAEAICAGLQGILNDLESGALEIDPTAEDIHMFVEAELTKRLGDHRQAPAHRAQPERSGGARPAALPAGRN